MKRKILLDIAMTVAVLCLLNTNLTGVAVHEMLGIGVFLLFLLHKLINFKWIKAVTTNLLRKTLNKRTKIQYAVDVLLLILTIANVATGLLISTSILPGIRAGNILATSRLHHILAYMLAATVVVHIGLHWTFILQATRIKRGSAAEKIVCCIATAALVILLMESNTMRNLLHPPKAFDFHYQTEQGNHKKEEETEQPKEHPTVPEVPTLEQYLSKLICTGCPRRCLLTNPACGKGRFQQEDAIQEYNQTYQTNETYRSDGRFPSDRPYKPGR